MKGVWPQDPCMKVCYVPSKLHSIIFTSSLIVLAKVMLQYYFLPTIFKILTFSFDNSQFIPVNSHKFLLFAVESFQEIFKC